MRRLIKEIRKIGLKDWLWFTFILKRNEFHKSLNKVMSERSIDIFHTRITIRFNIDICDRRLRAHRINEKINN